MNEITVYVFSDINTSSEINNLCFTITKRSILRYNPNIKVIELNNNFLIKNNIKLDDINKIHLLLPYLNNYKGYAIFCNCNFLWNVNIEELIDKYKYEKDETNTLIDTDFSICCNYIDYNIIDYSKIDFKDINNDNRINLNDLYIFNCSNCTILTIDFILKYDLKFKWYNNNSHYNIDISYNYLPNIYNTIKDSDIKCFNFINEKPWIKTFENCLFNEEWYQYLTLSEKHLLIKINDVKINY